MIHSSFVDPSPVTRRCADAEESGVRFDESKVGKVCAPTASNFTIQTPTTGLVTETPRENGLASRISSKEDAETE